MRFATSCALVLCAATIFTGLLASPVHAQEDWSCGTTHAPSIPVDLSRQLTEPVTIPVMVHVVWGRAQAALGGERLDVDTDIVGNISDAMIELQIDSLNQAYRGTDVSFVLSGISRMENQLWYENMRDYFDEVSSYLHVDPLHVLNLYVGRQPGIGGTGNFPFNSSTPVGSPEDGIFVNWRNFPGSTSSNHGGGDTAVHEVGHYLGLYHTFQGGCTYPNDHIVDTPAQASSTSGCPTTRDSCPGLRGLDPIHNYMDYTDDECKFMYTEEQNIRQNAILAAYRSELGDLVPPIYATRSRAVTVSNPTFSGKDIYVLPGANVTITGKITLRDGARLSIAGGGSNSSSPGIDLQGVTAIDLDGGSLLDIRGHSMPLDLSGDVRVAGGSTLRLGRQADSLNYPYAPQLAVSGSAMVTGEESLLDIGYDGSLLVADNQMISFTDGGAYRSGGSMKAGENASIVFTESAGETEFQTYSSVPTFALGRDARLVFEKGSFEMGGTEGALPLTVRRSIQLSPGTTLPLPETMSTSTARLSRAAAQGWRSTDSVSSQIRLTFRVTV